MLYRSAVIGLLYFLCVSTFSCKKSSLNSSEVDLIRKQLDEDLTTMLWAWSGGGQRSDLPNKYRKEVLQLNPLKPEISGAFDKAIQVSGLILTKLDGTAKGGVIAAIARQCPKPIRYIGVGEGIDDLRPFVAREFVDALFE